MKLYWLPLLILGTQVSVFTPSALASEPVAAPLGAVEVVEESADKGQTDPISLDKGFRRRRVRHHRIRHRDLPHRRLHHSGRRRSNIIIIRQGGRYDALRHGEFRRDHIYFRSAPFDRVHHDRFRRDRFHHNRFYYDRFEHFDHDGFRLIIRSD